MDRLQQEKEEEEEQRWKEEVEEKKIRLAKNALIFLSVLVVAMVPVAWCSTGQSALLVWRLSLLLCCSSFFCSRLLDVTVNAVTMFLAIFSRFMAALYADAVVDRDSGVLMAHLNSHLAAGLLGYALAMHCQHNGLQVTPTTASPPNKLSKKQANNAFHTQIVAWCYFGLVTTVVGARMAWVVCYRADYPTEYLVLQAFGPMAFALLLRSMFWV
jgi:hypothetical protein